MTTVIEIGTVPSNETPATDSVTAAIQAGAFIRQLQRMRPLLPESGAKYVAMQRAGNVKPWLSVVLAVPVGSWATAETSMQLAQAAQEVAHWDEEALMELHQRGIAPASYVAASLAA